MDSAHAHLSSTTAEEDNSFQVLLLKGRKEIYIYYKCKTLYIIIYHRCYK